MINILVAGWGVREVDGILDSLVTRR